MAAAVHSPNNPFRSQNTTPNTAGNTSSTRTSSSSNPPSFTSSPSASSANLNANSTSISPSSNPPSSTNSNTISSPASNTRISTDTRSDPIGLTDEMPPAYTPGPDVYQGETTVAYGPSRPFQPAPTRPPQQQSLSPQPTGWSNVQARFQPRSQPQSVFQQLAGRLTAELFGPTAQQRFNPTSNNAPSSNPQPGWSSYPGQQAPSPHQLSPQHSITRPPRTPQPAQPPPLLPPRTQSSSAPASRNVSEFALDFYAAGPGVDNPPTGQSPSTYAPPPGPPPSGPRSGSGFAPPPGPPPTTELRSPSPGVPDDGRPTTTPVPGHPLLKDGKLLVYPAGHECDKCHNTGYKQNDPSHPCRKCWSKYAKPFSGALAYTPWSPPSPDSPPSSTGTSSKSFQRPLPAFRSPQQQIQHRGSPTSYAPPVPNQSPFASAPRAQSPYAPPPPPQHPRVQQASPYAPPPAGAVVYQPGDPRIGGQMCWRCDGSGLVTFMLFEEVACGVCGGVGRVFG